MRILKLAAATAFTLVSLTALAGPADDAKAHFLAIGGGEVDKIMTAYGDDAVFQWVGGPLDGAYKGSVAG